LNLIYPYTLARSTCVRSGRRK